MASAKAQMSIALLGHTSTGKSSFVESAAFLSGKINELGTLQKKNMISDYEPEEHEKGTSVQLAVAHVPWKNVNLHLIDTPGSIDFSGDVISAITAADLGLLFIDASRSIEVGTITWFRAAKERKLPLVILLTGMDKEGASFEDVLADIKQQFGCQPAPLYYPLAASPQLKIASLLEDKTFLCNGKQTKESGKEEATNTDLWREKIIEAIAETDDALLEAYLGGETLSLETLTSTLSSAVFQGDLFPLLCALPHNASGIQFVLDSLTQCISGWKSRSFTLLQGEQEEIVPINTDAPFYGHIFKTTIDPYAGKVSYCKVWKGTLTPQTSLYNPRRGRSERLSGLGKLFGKIIEPARSVAAGEICALTKLGDTITGDTLCEEKDSKVFPPIPYIPPIYELAVEPEKKEDEEKIMAALHRLHEEDPSFLVRREKELRETIISGTGEAHLDLALARSKRKFHVSMKTRLPKIPYRETISRSAKAQGRYKKQSGGRGQFGDTFLEIRPLARGKGFEFVNKIVGGKIPKNYIPAVEKGIKEAMQKGVLSGFPMQDIQVILYDGSYHPVDSSDMAFQIAGSMGFKKACNQAQPILLEPIMQIEATSPQDFVGDIIGDINAKRGKIAGTEIERGFHKIKAYVPLVEAQRYAAGIRSLTGGRAIFQMSFDHYSPVPNHLASKIIEQQKEEKG